MRGGDRRGHRRGDGARRAGVPGRKSPTLELREQVVNELRPGGDSDLYHLTADRIDHERATLENVAIFDANDPMRSRTTYAARGEMAFNAERTDLYLTLYDGVVHESQSDRVGGFQRIYFKEQIVPLRGVGNELTRNLGGSDRSDREMDIATLSQNARERQLELDSLREFGHAQAVKSVRVALMPRGEEDSVGPTRPSPWVVPARAVRKPILSGS